MGKYTQADFDSAPRDADGWMELHPELAQELGMFEGCERLEMLD